MSNKDFHLHQGINFDQLINILAIYHIFDDDVIALRPLFLSCISCIGSSIYYLWHRLACLCNSFVTLCQGVGVRRMSHNTEDTAQSVAYWYIIKKECSITFYWIAFRKAMLVKSSTLSFDSWSHRETTPHDNKASWTTRGLVCSYKANANANANANTNA